MKESLKNNIVNLVGTITSNFTFNHEVFGESFYIAELKVERTSGNYDLIPIMVSDRAVDIESLPIGTRVKVFGQFRSFNKHGEEKRRLILSVFTQYVEFDNDFVDSNAIELVGYICKAPVYRKTPLGREIADLLLAVNRPYGKSDYIPCITWGRNARFAEQLAVGSCVKICGRIQSREFQKKISETETEQRVAYEVSVGTIELLEEGTHEE